MLNNAKKIKDYKIAADYQFPSENINPELKESPDYHLAYVRAMLSQYSGNKCEVPFDFGSDFTFMELRRYAQGKEGSDRVKKNFFGEKKKNPKTGKYPTSMNIDWEGIDVMPKFFDVMRAINLKMEYRTTTRAIDSESLQEKKLDREYLKMMLDHNTKDLLEKTKYHPNVPVSLEDIGAETEADVDLYFDSGAYTTQREIASEACIQKTRKESDHKILQQMWFDDEITLGIHAGRNYFDHANKLVKRRYVDPARCIIPYSKYLDFRNIDKFGEIRTMTIGELREEFPHIRGAVWRKLASEYAYLNPEVDAAISKVGYFASSTTNEYGQDPMNACKVEVLDAQWLTDDSSNILTNDKNENVYRPVSYAYDLPEKEKKKGSKIIQKNTTKKHFACWVIGTDTLLDYGISNDTVYYGPDGNKVPGLDYFVNKTGNKSLVERCVPHIEDIKLAVVKRRNTIAILPPGPRMIIQQHLLENVYIAGKLQQPEDLYQGLRERGVLVVNSLDDFNKPTFQNSKAIEYIPNGIIEDIAMYSNEIAGGIEKIRDVTGLNPTVDGSTPNPYVGLGKSQLAAAASNNALAPTFETMISFITRMDADAIKKWQIVAKNNKGYKLNHAPLGINTMEVLEIGEDFVNADLNIYTEIEYTDDEKQGLLMRLAKLAEAYGASSGAVGVSSAEYMHMEDLIMAGNFKFAKYSIARIERKREIRSERSKVASEQRTFQAQRENMMANNRQKMEADNYAARKEILKNRITEIEKRITKLYDNMNEHSSIDTVAPNPTGIMAQIEALNAKIDQLLAQDMEQDQMIMQQNMPQQQAS